MDHRVVALLILMMSPVFSRPNEWTWPRCPCPKLLLPVCSSNYITFLSPCEFKCYADAFYSMYKTKLYILKERRCEEEEA
ncbi:unnamed protein product [Parnassius apollo]|uniref:(apollo) hypothetical protein n=1 Tax=Parnassius apollo TaxID=110799 RepID=A0A8S3WF04_PARAO|nr:unnamed protein product [Parnassius apollo]